MRFVILFLVVILVAFLGTFLFMNFEERVDVHLPWQSHLGVPQFFLVLAAVASGAVFVGLLSVVDGIRLRLANRKLRRELDRLRQLEPAPATNWPGSEADAGRTERREKKGDPSERPVIPAAGGDPGDDPPYGI